MLSYTFIQNALIAGVIISIIAPILGVFLVLKRYTFIADTLAHISLAGIIISLVLGTEPIITTLIITSGSALGIEKLRKHKTLQGEWILALFLSGALAVALALISVGHISSAKAFGYLFGSITSITEAELITIAMLSALILVTIAYFWRQIIAITFDEEYAQIMGLPTFRINAIFSVLASILIVISIPIFGALLIGALMVIPAITALQLRVHLTYTISIAIIISLLSVLIGIYTSFKYDIAASSSIILTMLVFFVFSLFTKRR